MTVSRIWIARTLLVLGLVSGGLAGVRAFHARIEAPRAESEAPSPRRRDLERRSPAERTRLEGLRLDRTRLERTRLEGPRASGARDRRAKRGWGRPALALAETLPAAVSRIPG